MLLCCLDEGIGCEIQSTVRTTEQGPFLYNCFHARLKWSLKVVQGQKTIRGHAIKLKQSLTMTPGRPMADCEIPHRGEFVHGRMNSQDSGLLAPVSLPELPPRGEPTRGKEADVIFMKD